MRLILLTASALALSACATVPAPQPNSVPGMVSAAGTASAVVVTGIARLKGPATAPRIRESEDGKDDPGG